MIHGAIKGQEYKAVASMLTESLDEMLTISKHCISTSKNPDLSINDAGCYGYPAAILLLSIADMIGSYIIGGLTENHFKILNDKEYYNLQLEDEELKSVYKGYRCLLTHNGVLKFGSWLSIGGKDDKIFQIVGDCPILNLVPFYNLTVKAVEKFKNNDLETIVKEGKNYSEIL